MGEWGSYWNGISNKAWEAKWLQGVQIKQKLDFKTSKQEIRNYLIYKNNYSSFLKHYKLIVF